MRLGSVTVSFWLAAILPSVADELGCTALLCLSNPAGWANVPECVAPVKKVLNNLRRGGAFVCDSGSARTGDVVVSHGKKLRDRWIEWIDAAGVRHRENF